MEVYLKTIVQGNTEEAIDALEKLVEQAIEVFAFPELDKNDLRKEVWQSLFHLANTLKDSKVHANCFKAIRILCREKTSLNELITEEWLELARLHSGLATTDYCFEGDRLLVALEVNKCLCNLIFNSRVAAAMCSKNGILESLALRIKSYETNEFPQEIAFFDVKLLFLLTALLPEVRNKVRTDMEGVTSLVKMMEIILAKAYKDDKISLNDEQADIICEILKALFNLTLNCYGNTMDEEENKQCKQLVQFLRNYILIPVNSKEKSISVKSNVINLLTNIPVPYYQLLTTPIQKKQNISQKLQFEDHNMTAFYEMLLFLQELLSEERGVSKQYEVISPVISVLLKGARGDRIIRKYFRVQILPPLKDVHTRPEEGNTLRNHLCRLLTTPITQLRDIVAELLFVLCKHNVKRMIKYTGYGNAAGLFAQRGLLGGRRDKGEADFSEDSEDSETEEYAEFKHGINPVIGCYEQPRPSPMENMTEEQKEYEAMKLVELIDNLTKCGAIKPCRVGKDGKPHPIEHVLQLQEGLKADQIQNDSDSE